MNTDPQILNRSSHQRCSMLYVRGVLRNFTKFTENNVEVKPKINHICSKKDAVTRNEKIRFSKNYCLVHVVNNCIFGK